MIVDDGLDDPSHALWRWLLLLVGFGITRFALLWEASTGSADTTAVATGGGLHPGA